MNRYRSRLHNPPSTNRGVQNTPPLPHLESLIDWCAFTLLDDNSLYQALAIIGIPETDYVLMPKGGLGYKTQHRYGHISIFSDGKPDMGVHVEMSGKGCRQFDGISGNWRELFNKVFSMHGHFTRIDIAIDDRLGHFALATIQEKMQKREVRSRFKEGRETTSFSFTDEIGQEGKTLYFGSTKSDAKIRIYDKAVEQGVSGLWIRTEIECRRQRANILAGYLMETDDLGKVVTGVLKNYLAFVEPSIDSNKSRWPISEWWDNFLGSVERLKLSIKKAERTIEQVQEWFEKQAAPSLALIFKYAGGDLDFLCGLITKGEKKLKPRHFAMLNCLPF